VATHLQSIRSDEARVAAPSDEACRGGAFVLESPHSTEREPADATILQLAAMSAVLGALTALSLFVPSVGAFALWLLPSGGAMPWLRRRAATLLLALTTLLLLVHRLTGASIEFDFWRPLFSTGATIAFGADPLGSGLALLCAGAVAIVCAATLARPLERYEAVGMLWSVGSVAGIALAANLLTLCMASVTMDLGLLFIDTMHAPEEGIPRAVRNALAGLLSSAMLVVGTVLVISQVSGEGRPFYLLALEGAPQRFLMAAALLRLGVYPLPGSLKRNWLAYLASLCAGAYLWLRVASMSIGALPGQGWLVPLGGFVLLASGLLAFLAPDMATAVPALLLNGVTLLVLAPLLDRSVGVGVGLAATVGLALSLAILRADGQVRPFEPLGRWVRAPLVLALGSLAGWPGTVGFGAHWLFLRLCWVGGHRALLLVAAVSFLLVTVPLWSRLRQVMREVRRPAIASPRLARVAFGASALGALFLVLTGITPTLFGLFWPDVSGLVRPSVLTMFSGNLVQLTGLVLTAVILPAMGSYALQGVWESLPEYIGPWGDTVSALLELDWLYAGLDHVLGVLGHILARTLVVIEENLYLGWTLLWALVLAMYLIGR